MAVPFLGPQKSYRRKSKNTSNNQFSGNDTVLLPLGWKVNYGIWAPKIPLGSISSFYLTSFSSICLQGTPGVTCQLLGKGSKEADMCILYFVSVALMAKPPKRLLAPSMILVQAKYSLDGDFQQFWFPCRFVFSVWFCAYACVFLLWICVCTNIPECLSFSN